MKTTVLLSANALRHEQHCFRTCQPGAANPQLKAYSSRSTVLDRQATTLPILLCSIGDPVSAHSKDELFLNSKSYATILFQIQYKSAN